MRRAKLSPLSLPQGVKWKGTVGQQLVLQGMEEEV